MKLIDVIRTCICLLINFQYYGAEHCSMMFNFLGSCPSHSSFMLGLLKVKFYSNSINYNDKITLIITNINVIKLV